MTHSKSEFINNPPYFKLALVLISISNNMLQSQNDIIHPSIRKNCLKMFGLFVHYSNSAQLSLSFNVCPVQLWTQMSLCTIITITIAWMSSWSGLHLRTSVSTQISERECCIRPVESPFKSLEWDESWVWTENKGYYCKWLIGFAKQ